jgi:hypothetical protein
MSFEKSMAVQRGLDEKLDVGAMLEQIMEESEECNDEMSRRIQHIQAREFILHNLSKRCPPAQINTLRHTNLSLFEQFPYSPACLL